MTNPLGASWKPKVAGILTLIGPGSLWYLLTTYAHMDAANATALSGMLFAVLASYGLYNAKQTGVSNAPIPLINAQATATAAVVAVAPPPHPAVAPVVVLAADLGPHLV